VFRSSQSDFVRQQGFSDAEGASCAGRYGALMFQPRLLGILVAAGVALQSWELFLTLSAILWWNALMPSHNVFDAVYNRLIARPRGLPLLTAAPAPRRFAQGMAATFMLVIGVSLLMQWQVVAWVFQGLLAAALLALVFGRSCLGSYVYHLFRAKTAPGLSART
jgi:hypothetical protein